MGKSVKILQPAAAVLAKACLRHHARNQREAELREVAQQLGQAPQEKNKNQKEEGIPE